jgi:peptidoglycan-associated lipoprotein
MMKKRSLLVIFILTVAALTGCQSPGKNPAGVHGSIIGPMDMTGEIAMGGRFTGGTEHPGMFDPVLFAYDSSQVSSAERGKVEAVAGYLKENPATAVIIEGHCDERGSREYNLALGERRALAVRSYLVGLGIEADRIQTKSLGEESPAESGHNEAAWSLNRRGEFVLYY